MSEKKKKKINGNQKVLSKPSADSFALLSAEGKNLN
jgi:hypothetical protein